MAVNSDMREIVQDSLHDELDDGLDSSQIYTQAVDQQRIQRAVREILLAVGEDPDREGLRETPARVARMYAELFGGLHVDPRQHLKKFFTETCDEVVLVRDISFNSMCEHHMLPFMGTAHVAYLPQQARGRPEQAGPGRGGSRPPPAGPGTHDRANRQYAGRGIARQGRGRGDRGGAHLHDHSRRAQARLRLRHLGHEGLFPQQIVDACGTDDVDLRKSPLTLRRTNLWSNSTNSANAFRTICGGWWPARFVATMFFGNSSPATRASTKSGRWRSSARCAADVSACVHYARDNNFRFTPAARAPASAGESLGPGMIVDFSKYLRRVIRIDAEKVRVQAGVVLERLNAQLRPMGRIFGPDPAKAAVTTIGSMIALDAAGSRWLKYGPVRNYVISLQVVLADGEILELGREPLVRRRQHQHHSAQTRSCQPAGRPVERERRIDPFPPA